MHFIKEENNVIFYCNSYELNSIKEVFKNDIPRLYGQFDNESFCLMSLYVPEKMRNYKKATQLVYNVCVYCYRKEIKYIELDDMSDNYRYENNVYSKCGFKYKDDTGPEMYSTPQECMEHTLKLLKK